MRSILLWLFGSRGIGKPDTMDAVEKNLNSVRNIINKIGSNVKRVANTTILFLQAKYNIPIDSNMFILTFAYLTSVIPEYFTKIWWTVQQIVVEHDSKFYSITESQITENFDLKFLPLQDPNLIVIAFLPTLKSVNSEILKLSSNTHPNSRKLLEMFLEKGPEESVNSDLWKNVIENNLLPSLANFPDLIIGIIANKINIYLNLIADDKEKFRKITRKFFQKNIKKTKDDDFGIIREINQPTECKELGEKFVGSSLASFFISISCALYDVPVIETFQAWENVISKIPRIEGTPSSRIYHIANRISGKCYEAGKRNFMYDFLRFGKCNCLCGSNALYALYESIYPERIKDIYFVLVPRHIYLAVRQEDSKTDVKWSYIETTVFSENNIPAFVNPKNIDSYLKKEETPESILVTNDVSLQYFTELSSCELDVARELHRNDTLERLENIFSNSEICSEKLFGPIICIYYSVRMLYRYIIKSKNFKYAMMTPNTTWNDIINLFPENWNLSYDYNSDLKRLWNTAIHKITGQTLEAFPMITVDAIYDQWRFIVHHSYLMPVFYSTSKFAYIFPRLYIPSTSDDSSECELYQIVVKSYTIQRKIILKRYKKLSNK